MTQYLTATIVLLMAALHGAAAGAADIATLRSHYVQAFLNEDVDEVLAVIASEARILPEYHKAILDEDVSGYFAGYFDRFTVEAFEKSSQEVIEMGSMAADIGSFSLHVRDDANGGDASFEGSYIDVWEQGADGAWLLTTVAWNYDAPYDDVRSWTVQDGPVGVHLAFTPGAPVTSGASLDLAALHEFSDQAMMRGQAGLLHHLYAVDAVNMPHDGPPVHGRDAIQAFLESYGGNWPPFEFVKSTAHDIHEHGDYVVEIMSYNLRWNALSVSGVGIGKGVQIWKRDEDGSLRTYRAIAMHDQ